MSAGKLEPHYKPSEVALILGVTTETLRRWEKLGLLKARKLPSGHIRIPKSEVERLLSCRSRRMSRLKDKKTFNKI
jgi:excisionase family DNA binding protein